MFIRLAVSLASIFSLSPVISVGADYDFCVTRVSPTGSDAVRVGLRGEMQNPGREAAGQLIIRHYRQPPVATIRVEDYQPETCAPSDIQFLMLNGDSAPEVAVKQVSTLPDLGGGANLAAKAIGGAYMDLARQTIGAAGIVNRVAHNIICNLVKC